MEQSFVFYHEYPHSRTHKLFNFLNCASKIIQFRISFSGQQDVGVVSGVGVEKSSQDDVELGSMDSESSDAKSEDIHEVILPYSSIFYRCYILLHLHSKCCCMMFSSANVQSHLRNHCLWTCLKDECKPLDCKNICACLIMMSIQMNASKLLKLLSGIHCVPILWKGTKLKIKNKNAPILLSVSQGNILKAPKALHHKDAKF